jgi:hypothetical protein
VTTPIQIWAGGFDQSGFEVEIRRLESRSDSNRDSDVVAPPE